jgi:prophage regulatory protein
MDTERLLRRQQVEEMCAIGRAYLYRLIANGEFPAPVKVGVRAVRWRESDVLRWISERKRAS